MTSAALAPDPATRRLPSKPPRRGRAAAGLAAVLVLAAGAAVAVTSLGGSDEPEPAAPPTLFTSASHEVTYEVTGAGPVEEIVYVVGAGNKLKTVANPTMPFKVTVQLDVGHAGGTALINAANTGLDRLTCAVFVDGKPAYQITGQKQTDVSCSATLAPGTAPAE